MKRYYIRFENHTIAWCGEAESLAKAVRAAAENNPSWVAKHIEADGKAQLFCNGETIELFMQKTGCLTMLLIK